MDYIIGIDAGTTAFKGAIFDDNGKMIALHSVACPLIYLPNSRVECSAKTYESTLLDLLKGLFEKSGISADKISALSIDSQGETLLCVDHNGSALGNAIVWLDNRAVSQADEIRENFGIKTIYETTGQPDSVATWPACKIRWLEQNEPDIFKRTYKFLLLEDYLIFKLTGKFATERSLVSSSLYYDIKKGTWWNDMLDHIGISSKNLPQIYDSGTVISFVSAHATPYFGLSQNTAVVSGALDQLSGMIGAGVFKEDMACETTGTCLSLCLPVKKIPEYDKTLNIPCHAGPAADSFYQIYWSQTAGAVLEWFKNSFYPELKDKKNPLKMIDEQASKVPPGSENLIMIPHLSGTAFPEFNSNAKGVFFGIGFEHKRSHFSRAIMESVAYMLKEFLDYGANKGILPNEIHSLGGGSKSSLWNQIKADITEKKIVTLKNTEAACLGTAILAGKGIGLFDSISDASKRFVSTDKVFVPDDNNNAVYSKGYLVYKQLYENLKSIYSGV